MFSTVDAALAQGSAAGYPSRPVSVVLPLSPGGVVDAEARLLTAKLQTIMGQPFVLDFRPGAGQTIGIVYTHKAAPDGYTFMMANSGITITPNFYPALSHQAVSQLIPITELTQSLNGLIISTTALPNVRSLKDLVAYVKANPGALNCGTTGGGGQTHMVCAGLANAMGIAILPVHYKGSAAVMTDLRAGRIQMFSGGLSRLSGDLRMIAILRSTRSPSLPDLPTSFEQGYEVDSPNWLGAFAPPNTPSAIINRLNAELVKAVKSPEVVAALDKMEFNAVGSAGEEFRKKIAGELAYWKKIIEDNKIRLE